MKAHNYSGYCIAVSVAVIAAVLGIGAYMFTYFSELNVQLQSVITSVTVEGEPLSAVSQQIFGLFQETKIILVATVILVFSLLLFLSWGLWGSVRQNHRKGGNSAASGNADESYYKIAMDYAGDGIVVINLHGNVAYINRCALYFLQQGKAGQEGLLGQPWYQIFPEDVQASILSEAVSTMERETTWEGEYDQILGEEKHRLQVNLLALPQKNMLLSLRDITQRYQIDREREELQTQFYQAQKMEAVGRLAGGVAHDFNNILSAISGYAEFLSEDLPNNSNEYNFATKILVASNQAKKLVDQILTFSRKNDAIAEDIDIVPLIKENLSMIKISARQAIEIVSDIDVDSAVVQGNSNHIAQTLMNLCVNAVDAMEGKQGVLSLDVRTVSGEDGFLGLKKVRSFEEIEYIVVTEGGTQEQHSILHLGALVAGKQYVKIDVKDTGAGMSEALLSRVFDPFFTTKPVSKGTGLGLSTVQGVVAQHKGAMAVETIMGVGTKFSLLFPLYEQEKGRSEADMSSQDKGVDLSNIQILLVEDQKTVRDVNEIVLTRMGARISVAKDGEEALRVLKEQYEAGGYFDVVYTDHAMPKITGAELAEICDDLYPGLPFIIASGYKQESVTKMLESLHNVQDVMLKPVKSNRLRQALAEIVAKRDSWQHKEDKQNIV